MVEMILAYVVSFIVGHFGSAMLGSVLTKVGIPQAVASQIVKVVFDLFKTVSGRDLTENEKQIVQQRMERVFRDPFDSRN